MHSVPLKLNKKQCASKYELHKNINFCGNLVLHIHINFNANTNSNPNSTNRNIYLMKITLTLPQTVQGCAKLDQP